MPIVVIRWRIVATFLSLLILGTVRMAAAQHTVQVLLDGNDTGRIFAGAEPQRSQILDYLFKPNYGASAPRGMKLDSFCRGTSAFRCPVRGRVKRESARCVVRQK
jgi:hypothetical protein